MNPTTYEIILERKRSRHWYDTIANERVGKYEINYDPGYNEYQKVLNAFPPLQS